MITKLLIANRGEIACRVMDTARKLGIATVAVYSDADANARHVRVADEAVHIGPPAAAESYLLGDKLIAAAKATGAQAIHPGYGFLSENAGFARACRDAGIIFVGPPPEAIDAMGLKDAAKKIMSEAGVPVVPGYQGEKQDVDFLSQQADDIGYPVLIKAVAGGGGKGMRKVEAAKDFKAALEGAKREAAAAFGNDHVLLEKFVTRPRHIEVQVFADSHGNAVHLFERDCSLQRRHQKVVEEAPAPDMPAAVRAAMGDAAVKAAQAIGYVGAGTVEFIVDSSNGITETSFYFMEMNTRLQVEHPVTEMITGTDLVAWQLAVAAGGELPKSQDELSITGHAFEVRLYAEDPAKGFLPATGTLTALDIPHDIPGVRFDTGVEAGDAVSVYYDPMIGKLITHGPDREQALARMRAALAGLKVGGLTTNADFLAHIAAHPEFMAGDVHTGFIEAHLEKLVPPVQVADTTALIVGALFRVHAEARAARTSAAHTDEPASPWVHGNAWRLNLTAEDTLYFRHDGEVVGVTIAYLPGGGYTVTLPDGSARPCSATLSEDNLIAVTVDGHRFSRTVVDDNGLLRIAGAGGVVELACHDPGAAAEEGGEGSGAVTAPMPGKVTQVLVAGGEVVEKGQALLILEAMKMEHTITAPIAGTVTSLPFAAGEQVADGATLVVVEAVEEG